MAKSKNPKARFTTTLFLKAWKDCGEKAKTHDEFILMMRAKSGDKTYPEARILERIAAFTKDLKAAKIKPPKYPKKRVSAAVSAALALGW